jgi:hypothetical protein
MTFQTVPSEQVVQLSQRLLMLIAHLDNRRYDALADIFTPAGRWLRQGRWLEGRQAILDALESRPMNMQVRHVLTNSLVTDFKNGQARVDAYMTAYRQLEGQRPELFSINRVDTIFHSVDGQWLIAEQQMVREFEFTAA